MIRRRLGPVFTALLILASLLIGTAAAPVLTAASGPSWSMTVEPVPEMVSSGDTAAYLVTITNHGPRKITKLELEAATPGGATFLASTASQGWCDAGPELDCYLGDLKKDRWVTVLAVYQAPTTGDDLEVRFRASGRPAGDDDDDRRVLVRKGETELVPTTDPDFAGRFVLNPDQRVVANDQVIGGSNQHSTRVLSPETNIATWVNDVQGLVAGCGGSGGLPCFGAISEIHVNDGATYPGGFKVIITFGVGELPLEEDHSGSETIEAEDLHLQHELDDGSTQRVRRCDNDDDDDDRRGSEARLPCFEAWDLNDGSIRARVFLTQNGRIQGW